MVENNYINEQLLNKISAEQNVRAQSFKGFVCNKVTLSWSIEINPACKVQIWKVYIIVVCYIHFNFPLNLFALTFGNVIWYNRQNIYIKILINIISGRNLIIESKIYCYTHFSNEKSNNWGKYHIVA